MSINKSNSIALLISKNNTDIYATAEPISPVNSSKCTRQDHHCCSQRSQPLVVISDECEHVVLKYAMYRAHQSLTAVKSQWILKR
jgi:hypothetical protein